MKNVKRISPEQWQERLDKACLSAVHMAPLFEEFCDSSGEAIMAALLTAKLIRELDDSPLPDFSWYVEEMGRVEIVRAVAVQLSECDPSTHDDAAKYPEGCECKRDKPS